VWKAVSKRPEKMSPSVKKVMKIIARISNRALARRSTKRQLDANKKRNEKQFVSNSFTAVLLIRQQRLTTLTKEVHRKFSRSFLRGKFQEVNLPGVAHVRIKVLVLDGVAVAEKIQDKENEHTALVQGRRD
jgi:hypothetical protein